jgi:hypothetical protein
MTQSVRQAARRRAREAQALRRKESAATERRRASLGIEIVGALTDRDEAVARFERVAAQALSRLLQEERLSLADACEWVDGLSVSEARRLHRLLTSSEQRSNPQG